MQHGYQMVREAVRQFPLPLTNINSKLQQIAASYLPFSTGIEIECEGDNDAFYAACIHLSNLMTFNTDRTEVRFRIPSGIEGMICLYEVCEILKKTHRLNMASGIHYHVDFTDCFDKVNSKFILDNNDWVLNSLKSWNYTGEFNEWICSTAKTAVKYHFKYKTVEFRIGEMSFDYELLIKRIIHAQNISRKLKANLV
jgi:hypothetical protein